MKNPYLELLEIFKLDSNILYKSIQYLKKDCILLVILNLRHHTVPNLLAYSV